MRQTEVMVRTKSNGRWSSLGPLLPLKPTPFLVRLYPVAIRAQDFALGNLFSYSLKGVTIAGHIGDVDFFAALDMMELQDNGV
jgi:hypothetical protein